MHIEVTRTPAGSKHEFMWHLYQYFETVESVDGIPTQTDVERVYIAYGPARTRFGAKYKAKKVARRYVEDRTEAETVSSFDYLRGRMLNEV